ncbi:creatininase family protein [Maribacter polysiphoniae]|uniref:Creatininase family protein n=1 Tax=Maribacter polysiphoniae TaxID=429344 RepID=A0A316DMK6_9FLAO|nr:creatininase family protein [Maribacter polysiphoniae]MBD1262947.1 creatininase family protein [Maribacter polysiphoniae]PWK19364.1 creatinine amidohydrolase [Maribacter polysiphoniae]
MRPYILAETNWKALKDDRFDVAVLPWGATEAHNYHLPYGTDVYESDLLAAGSAKVAWEKGGRAIVLPSIPFGVNTGQSDIYLDINLNPSTQLSILCDVVEVLNRQGVKKLLIFNSHGGNNFKPLVRELGLKYPDMFICFANWFQSLDKTTYFEHEGDHADEMETSLMLYLKPDLVLPKEHWGTGASKGYKIKSFTEGWVWAERKWSQISEDTGVGNPTSSTKEKGERFFKDVTQKVGDFIFELCKADLNDLYE